MSQNNKSSIFELFNMLDKENMEKSIILKRLKIKAPTFYKDIQKLKTAGFNIKKRNNLYSLKNYKHVLNFDNQEKSVIAYMLNTAITFLPNNKYICFQKFINKFLLLTSESDYNEVEKKFQLIKKYSLIEQYREKIDILENCIFKKQIIKITLNSGKILTIKPLQFNWKRKKASFLYINIDTDKKEMLNMDSVVKIENNDDNDYISDEKEIIFELYGNLAKRYLLNKDERIVKSKKDTIVVASCTKDKDALFKRLFRYDTLCKILFPKDEVENFNKLIDKAIINLDLYESYE